MIESPIATTRRPVGVASVICGAMAASGTGRTGFAVLTLDRVIVAMLTTITTPPNPPLTHPTHHPRQCPPGPRHLHQQILRRIQHRADVSSSSRCGAVADPGRVTEIAA